MTLISSRARAYVNYGRWVADCPINCGGALKLHPGQNLFHCTECKTISEIEWPSNAQEIWEELETRIAPRNRNWFPSNHDLAMRANMPHGQSVSDLRDEKAEHERA